MSKLLEKNFNKNVILNYVVRIVGIVLGLFATRINLTFLGESIYGMWVTIASIASWINYGDIGIGNGLRNELAKAYAENDLIKQKKLINTAIIILALLGVGLLLILIVASEILFATEIIDVTLRGPMYITNIFFCLDFILGISRSIAYGYQRSWLTSLAQTGTVGLRIIGVWVLILLSKAPNLIAFSVVNGIGGIAGNILLISILRFGVCNGLRPLEVDRFDKCMMSCIFKLGVGFFVLQISCLILYSTDNLIIQYLYSNEAVTKYSIITTVYNTGETLFSIVLINLWSAVTFAFAKFDIGWIFKTLKMLLLFWLLFSVGTLIVSVCLNMIIGVWLGRVAIEYDWQTILIFCVYMIATSFGAIFVNITNGLGRLKMQLICSIIGMIANIPLSIFFAKVCGMGLVGIKLGTLICCFGSIVMVPIDISIFLLKMKRASVEK